MYCTNCGKKVEANNLFCRSCGVRLNNRDYYDVVLEYVGEQKIAVIKFIREINNVSLKETIDLLQKTPVIIARSVSTEQIEKIKK